MKWVRRIKERKKEEFMLKEQPNRWVFNAQKRREYKKNTERNIRKKERKITYRQIGEKTQQRFIYAA